VNDTLRVLHLGNIGNNAYLNAKFLRAEGVDCHVLSYDYYDRFATPEWEGDERPPWFVQGPVFDSVAYLHALLDGDAKRRSALQRRLRRARAIPPDIRFRVRRAKIRAAAAKERVFNRSTADPGAEASDESDDAAAYRETLPVWNELFDRYDLVQAYATDPIWPFLTRKHPYVGYEHGTLRVIADGSDAVARVAVDAYRESDHTFITNGDCLDHAKAIGIASFSAMIHPLDVELHGRVDHDHNAAIRRRLEGKVVLFCPMRHDWEVKGTDVHIRALPRIVADVEPDTVLVLCEWGRDVSRSRALAADLGVAERIVWLKPLRRRELIAHLQAADVVLDQMTLPHFDATVPQALAAGTPVVMSYEPESTAWIVGEPAPIVSAFDAAGVVDAVRTTIDEGWRREFAERARAWVDREHHPRRLVAEHLRVYHRLLRRNAPATSVPAHA
jgi:glycosyltransferase involved in cell wall biosynthesis